MEVESALAKISSNKSPGPDLIPNEFLIALPEEGKNYFAEICNMILNNEKMRDAWGESETVMLYKKGDPSCPVNYRPIALLNTSLKLFTQILSKRLTKWADDEHILPQAQGGFRAGRGCDDQIFCLNTAVQLSLRKKKGKLYACFFDFERAFPSICHKLLWEKLFKLGLSSKIIRILKELYDKSSTSIRMHNEGNSPNISLTEGLMQGEVLSPLLFSLFISDIEEVLRKAGIPGVKIRVNEDLQILLFADDTVTMANSARYLQQKIDILRKYFMSLGLKVNLAKTKVVVFRKGGMLARGTSFMYGDEAIEIVNEYTYLGVTFSYKGVFSKASKNFIQKGKAALGSVWKVVFGGKMHSFEAKMTLFDSIAASCTLYSSHIWALRYLNNIEQLQHYFVKRILGVSRTTPHYLLRLETAIKPLRVRIVKQILLFLIKILRMSDDRYPKMCYNALVQQAQTCESNKFNWLAQVQELLNETGSSLNCINCSPEEIIAAMPVILGRISQVIREEDLEKVKNSNKSAFYEQICPPQGQAAGYINLNLPFHIASLLAQCRINRGSFFFDKKKLILDLESICKFCNCVEFDTLQHFVCNCKIHEGSRMQIKHVITQAGWPKCMEFKTQQSCKEMFYFLSTSIRNRLLILEEEIS